MEQLGSRQAGRNQAVQESITWIHAQGLTPQNMLFVKMPVIPQSTVNLCGHRKVILSEYS